MHIAVASRDGLTVAGHIGQCADWIIFDVAGTGADTAVQEVARITLPRELIFHHYRDDAPHPLELCSVLIGASAGESFSGKLRERGIRVVLTAERNPARAVSDYVNLALAPPKARPIGSLICKIHDRFSSVK
ncbi:NifB/NifX family molybdenum-iron cluster-binding protein [Mariprofundus ferrooxydans]|uniref:NifB/NifX family molybdenum-iron cluster-binding protein n=1 Tax=Mariprofundus ferrooxydans TaxID=314344 RepID=UPI00037563F7|nr:NifB/NifX family molybdenum-iron cluster-binding protein [Mariprofundus ferrooxydans]